MYCKYCGKELIDGASFCPYCGKEINAVESTEANTPLRAYENQPVNSGIEYMGNQKKKSKIKHIALIVAGMVVVCILFLFIYHVILPGRQTSETASEDTCFDDAIASIQGDWYLWVGGEFWHFSIEETSYELSIQDTHTLENTEVSGHIEDTDQLSVMRDNSIAGTLEFIDSSSEKAMSFYCSNGEGDSAELKYEGIDYRLGDQNMVRYDYFGRIMELLQGQWTWTAVESGKEYSLNLTVDGNSCVLLVYDGTTIYPANKGTLSLYSYGCINVCDDDDIILYTLDFNYDADSDSIVLSDGDITIRSWLN